MSEKLPGVGNFSFEDDGRMNPYDKYIAAKQLAKNTVETLKTYKKNFEKLNPELVQPGISSSIAVFDEFFSELLVEVKDKKIEIEDEQLREYVTTPSYSIDSDDYEPDSEIPFIEILKAVGYSEEDVMSYYDFTKSGLPEEKKQKSIATMKIVRIVYGK